MAREVAHDLGAALGAPVLDLRQVTALPRQPAYDDDGHAGELEGVLEEGLRVVVLVLDIRLVEARGLLGPAVEGCRELAGGLEALIHGRELGVVLNAGFLERLEEGQVHGLDATRARAAAKPVRRGPAKDVDPGDGLGDGQGELGGPYGGGGVRRGTNRSGRRARRGADGGDADRCGTASRGTDGVGSRARFRSSGARGLGVPGHRSAGLRRGSTRTSDHIDGLVAQQHGTRRLDALGKLLVIPGSGLALGIRDVYGRRVDNAIEHGGVAYSGARSHRSGADQGRRTGNERTPADNVAPRL